MRNLNDACNNAKSYKTQAGAQRRLDRVDTVDPKALAFVFARYDGKFVPVVILNNSTMWAARTLCDAGIFVTNG